MITDDQAKRGDEIDIIVAALRQKYGSDALSVAQSQLSAASGDTRQTWVSIRDQLFATAGK